MAEQNIDFEWVDIHSGSHKLTGKLFKPAGHAKRIIVIHGATAISQNYYEPFARWLADEHSAHVLTYDYRDFGLSRRAIPIQLSRVSMSDWGIMDQGAALSFACKRFPELAVWVIGHSLGGLFLRWHEYRSQVERFITVASGPAHINDHPASYKPVAIWFWYLGGPVLTALLGYLPGRLSGLGSDLPAGVYWQWRRWCISLNFYENDIGAQFNAPPDIGSMADFTAIAIEDDPMIPLASVAEIETLYDGIDIAQKCLKPSDYGLEKVGHYRVFSRKCAAMWPAIIA